MQNMQYMHRDHGVHTPKRAYKKPIVIFGILLVLIFMIAFVWKGCEKNNGWVCENGQWVNTGDVDTPQPTEACQGSDEQNKPEERVKPAAEFIEADRAKPTEGIDIRVMSPHVNETITSPLKIIGEAKGWFVEDKILVQLFDDKGNMIAQSEAMSKDDVGGEYMSFETSMEFDRDDLKAGDLVFKKINPSNDPVQARTFSFPIFFE